MIDPQTGLRIAMRLCATIIAILSVFPSPAYTVHEPERASVVQQVEKDVVIARMQSNWPPY